MRFWQIDLCAALPGEISSSAMKVPYRRAIRPLSRTGAHGKRRRNGMCAPLKKCMIVRIGKRDRSITFYRSRFRSAERGQGAPAEPEQVCVPQPGPPGSNPGS